MYMWIVSIWYYTVKFSSIWFMLNWQLFSLRTKQRDYCTVITRVCKANYRVIQLHSTWYKMPSPIILLRKIREMTITVLPQSLYAIAITVLLFTLIPLTSIASDTPLKTARWYKIYWKAIHIADFRMGIDGESLVSNIDSQGLAQKISKYKNYTSGSFHKIGDAYLPVHFDSSLRQRQGTIKVRLDFDKNGNITEESVIPPDKRYKRPAVANASKVGVVDPLTAIMVAKSKIETSLSEGEKEFSFNIYDGRRLFRLDFNIYGIETIKALEKNWDVVKIGFRRFPLEGFTNNELKRMKGEDPDFIVYLEKDSLIPVKADAAAPLGRAMFVLVKECDTVAECQEM